MTKTYPKNCSLKDKTDNDSSHLLKHTVGHENLSVTGEPPHFQVDELPGEPSLTAS